MTVQSRLFSLISIVPYYKVRKDKTGGIYVDRNSIQ